MRRTCWTPRATGPAPAQHLNLEKHIALEVNYSIQLGLQGAQPYDWRMPAHLIVDVVAMRKVEYLYPCALEMKFVGLYHQLGARFHQNVQLDFTQTSFTRPAVKPHLDAAGPIQQHPRPQHTQVAVALEDAVRQLLKLEWEGLVGQLVPTSPFSLLILHLNIQRHRIAVQVDAVQLDLQTAQPHDWRMPAPRSKGGLYNIDEEILGCEHVGVLKVPPIEGLRDMRLSMTMVTYKIITLGNTGAALGFGTSTFSSGNWYYGC